MTPHHSLTVTIPTALLAIPAPDNRPAIAPEPGDIVTFRASGKLVSSTDGRSQIQLTTINDKPLPAGPDPDEETSSDLSSMESSLRDRAAQEDSED